MRWSPKQVDRLLLEMATQAQASSWSDRHAADRTRVLSEILRRYGWIRRGQHPPDHPPEVANTAWMIAMHAAGNRSMALRLHTLGCLFAESHSTAPAPGNLQHHHRKWFQLWRKPNGSHHAAPSPIDLALREQFARLLDQTLSDLNAATVFGTTRPELRYGRLINPVLCCPNDIVWLRNALGARFASH